MTKKMTIAEAVLTVAEAVREVKDAQQAHQASQDAFTQTVNEALAQVISREEVALMIKEAELDDVTHEDVQQAILAAVADKAASEAVNEANAAQDAAIDRLNTVVQSLEATSVQTLDSKAQKIIRSNQYLATHHGLVPIYKAVPIMFMSVLDVIYLHEKDSRNINNYIQAKEQGNYALNSGWQADGFGVISGNTLSFSGAGLASFSHPQLDGKINIEAMAISRAEAAQVYLDGITAQKSGNTWSYSANGKLMNYVLDESWVSEFFWRVDGSQSLRFMGFPLSGNNISWNQLIQLVTNRQKNLNTNTVFANLDGSETEGSPLKEFGFVLKDGTRLSRSFG